MIAVAVLVGLAYAGLFALVTFVQPKPREMTIRIPQDRFDR